MAREPIIHTLKALPIYFDAVARGDKTFEVRKNDRAYQTGDIVELCRWLPEDADGPAMWDEDFEPIKFRIGWILQGGQFGIEPGTCVFSLQPLEAHAHADR